MTIQFAALRLLVTPAAIIAILLTAMAASANTEEKPQQLPAEAFYQLPLVTNIRLSPDGTHIIALKNFGAETAVMTMNMATGEVFYPAKTDNKKFKIRWIDWANNDRILLSILFAEGEFGISLKFTYTRLLAMDAKKTSSMLNLVKPKSPASFTESTSADYASQYQDNVIGKVPNEPNNILISVDNNVPQHQTVYKVDVTNAHTSTVKKEDIAQSWIADRQGVPRIGEIYDDKEKKVSYKVLDPTTNKWIKVWSYIVFENPSITPLGFGKDATELYLLADHEGTQALYKADLSKEGYPWTLILSNPNRDINGRLIYSDKLNDVVGIYYNDGEDKSVFFNEEFKKFQAGIDKALPSTTNYISNMSDDGRKYILYTTNDTTPGVIYFGDRDTKQLLPIATLYPQLAADVLVKKEFLTYKARDELELGGFLTKPKSFKDKPVATIIFPHGGPMAEDGSGFDEFSAFFANRGYAVFQPNFRGSSGRGFEFEMKAVGAFGLAMQDDLEDAVKFLVDKKITDPKRVCIVGGSYGGYAALMGATKTPDLFQCAISLAGISDMKKLRENAHYFVNKNVMKEQLGNDTDQLKKTSPVRMVDKIKIPILLIHGSDDAIVPVEQSRMMADELKDQKKTYEYIELKNGSHHFDYLPHRKQTFEAMDAFLKKYLPVE